VGLQFVHFQVEFVSEGQVFGVNDKDEVCVFLDVPALVFVVVVERRELLGIVGETLLGEIASRERKVDQAVDVHAVQVGLVVVLQRLHLHLLHRKIQELLRVQKHRLQRD